MIKIDTLRYFVTVAQTGSLAAAGDKLGRTPSAVSMMVKQFETHLGEPLFESDRKSRLTAVGSFALERSIRALEHFDQSVASIEQFARSEAGFVRIAAVPSVAVALLPQVVRQFLSDHPGVRLDIQDMDSAAVIREIARERVDLGIATDVGTTSGISRDELFSDAFGVVCREDHPLAKRQQALEWADLRPWPFLANGLCANITDIVFQEVFSSSHLMVHNTTSLLAMVRAGVGLTVLPRLVVTSAEHELCFLNLADRTARRRIDLLHRANHSLPPAVRSFEQAVRQTIKQVPLSE